MVEVWFSSNSQNSPLFCILQDKLYRICVNKAVKCSWNQYLQKFSKSFLATFNRPLPYFSMSNMLSKVFHEFIFFQKLNFTNLAFILNSRKIPGNMENIDNAEKHKKQRKRRSLSHYKDYLNPEGKLSQTALYLMKKREQVHILPVYYLLKSGGYIYSGGTAENSHVDNELSRKRRVDILTRLLSNQGKNVLWLGSGITTRK